MNSLNNLQCDNCCSTIDKRQKLCEEGGHAIKKEPQKITCLGMIDLTPCANVITYNTRFCPNCGTKNPQYASVENTTDDSHDGYPSEIDVPSAGENTTEDSNDGCPPELKVPSADTVVSFFTEVDEKTLLDEIKTDIAVFKFDLKMKYGGIMALAQYLSKQTESSKKVKVNVAVAGESGTGKSSFINAIRGVKHGDSSFAEVGFGDTTMEIKKYQHPKNKRIQLYDLPGYNTTQMTLQNLLKDLNLSDFDCCLLFFYPVPSPADKTFVQQLQTAGTKFCFIRAKIDEDFENGEQEGISKEEVLSEIKKKVDMSSDHFEELKNTVKFYISSDEPSVGEMNELISFIEKQINPRKFEALLLSLPSLTEEVIQKKYQSLQKSAVILAIRFAVFYPMFFKIEKNIKEEIEMYFQTFELNTTLENNVKDLKHRFSEGICHLLEEFDNGVSGMWSPRKRYYFCKTFMRNLIDELLQDAKTMYKHMFNELRQ
ncbi:unnamed protein product [Mytilus coruscus]|uniref:IRG-type G domain-containing protein n=1 Tax=Mytilus coruscus TaxID=42192 RepID=A0A6J8CYK5_MYTCO|nr:unnamed protein product [Mytilus coruscus]